MPALQFDRSFLIGFKMCALSKISAARAAAQAQPGTLGLGKRQTGDCDVYTKVACIWAIGLRAVLCHAGLILSMFISGCTGQSQHRNDWFQTQMTLPIPKLALNEILHRNECAICTSITLHYMKWSLY
jgi:hypothetical protein